MHVVVLLVLLEQEFLAYTLAIIYIGAIVVLFLFVIMMFYLRRVTSKSSIFKISLEYGFLGCAVASLYETYSFFCGAEYANYAEAASITEFTAVLSRYLFSDLAIFSILAAVVMLVGIIGAITLTVRGSGLVDTKVIKIRSEVTDSLLKIK